MLIWWVTERPLAPPAAEAIADPDVTVLVSAVSIWEAEVKIRSGKLKLDVDLVEQTSRNEFGELAIDFTHGVEAGRLPPHHRDPFDRMLIAQARVEGLTLVSRDARFGAYDVDVLPA